MRNKIFKAITLTTKHLQNGITSTQLVSLRISKQSDDNYNRDNDEHIIETEVKTPKRKQPAANNNV